MKNIILEPWVGENYANGVEGKKILALGDSLYGDEGNSSYKLVEHFITYKNGDTGHMNWMNTYTRFTNVILGEKADKKKTIDFWNSIVFYNYVQHTQIGNRKAPPDEDYLNSHEAFTEALEEFQPDLIFVWGWGLWSKITRYGVEADFNILENRELKFYYFESKGKKIPAFGHPHPSTPIFNIKDWTPYLQAAIKKA